MLRLRVSDNGRFLVREDGSLFFWMGDTGWALGTLPPEDVDLYLSHRAQHGFNVIQMNCTHRRAGHADSEPFLNRDSDTPNEAYWSKVDALVTRAQEYAIYLALVPMWGGEYARAFGTDAEQAYRLGRWLGERYAPQPNVLWISSGEYDSINGFVLPITAEQRSLFTALGRGLRDGHGGANLTTIHPGVAFTSSLDFHQEKWLDFNMLQSGHENDREAFGHPENYTSIAHDYNLAPTKPVLDGEPFYEDTPDGIWIHKDTERPRGGADVVRRKAYWAVLAGAFGHTYGHNDMCTFFEPTPPGQGPAPPLGSAQRYHWKEALDAPGALQMKRLRALMESHSSVDRIPDQSLLVSPPGSGLTHLQATRAADGSFALVYLPAGGTVTVDLSRLAGPEATATWFDPRTGACTEVGTCAGKGERSFTAPGENVLGNDWVLVLAGARLGDSASGAGRQR